MTHAIKARKERGAKIVVIDIYDNPTIKQADMGLVLKPARMRPLPAPSCTSPSATAMPTVPIWSVTPTIRSASNGISKTAGRDWASAITGLPVQAIEDFARLVGTTKRSYFRLGYGFTRQRNGAVAMHAAASVPTVLGSWQYEGGGAFHTNNDIFRFDKRELVGAAMADPAMRMLDQSQIGRVLTGDAEALRQGRRSPPCWCRTPIRPMSRPSSGW